jgi:hypothetical protein
VAGFQAAPQGANIMVSVFGGDRQPMPDGARILITIRDGNQNVVHRDFHDKPNVFLTGLPVFNNFGDNYTVLASADGCLDAGFFPVRVAANVSQSVDLMLLPKSSTFNFRRCTWKALQKERPALRALLTKGAANANDAEQRYTQLIESGNQPKAACLLNLGTAMAAINMPHDTALSYVKQVIWDRIQQDRLFVWADAALLDQVNIAMQHGEFMPVPFLLHAGATRSVKQLQFGEANVQLTFHENDKTIVGGVNCILLEPDIDYFKDLGAHALLEVIPNSISGSLSDPRTVYFLRWMAGRHAGVPDFDPLYTVEKA